MKIIFGFYERDYQFPTHINWEIYNLDYGLIYNDIVGVIRHNILQILEF